MKEPGENDDENDNIVLKWQNVPTKSAKRVNEESPKLHQKKQVVIHPNRFDLLSDDDDQMKAGDDENLAANKEAAPTTPKPPPLIIPGVSNISEMINHISRVIDKKEFSYKSLTDGKIRLVVNNIEAYRKTVKNLDISKISYHTYQPKQERSYRVVLKGIHYSTPIEEISNSITQLGHKVRNIYNVKSRINKQPLSMFFVDLEPNDNNKEIYAMRHLKNAIIRIEPPR